MLSTLLRPRKGRRAQIPFNSSSPYASPAADDRQRKPSSVRHAAADWTETDDSEEEEEEDSNGPGAEEQIEEDDEDEDEEPEGDEGQDHEDGRSATPLLPLFSAAHLDAIPIYNLTHAIRLVVLPRCETTLSWDQLRSPQVSQFLVKPMQQQIRTSHFSKATLYALLANCLQFSKEAQMNPSNAGNSRTRAVVCELLAIKLLKEYTTRELIDALSYDFYPLMRPPVPASATGEEQKSRLRPAAAAASRISALEVAIRAQAKKFLAHPVVVQQLEAIWAGSIVFHSTADQLHRQKPVPPSITVSDERSPLLGNSPDKIPPSDARGGTVILSSQTAARRTVTLYDPRDASLFKLSRLRVPRYRHFCSTCSLAVFLGLFLCVLSRRSSAITPLELVFWLWSAGFMLDEIVGFNEQGFSLYIMSIWNTFDLGILFLLLVFYCMRLYGIFIVDAGRHEWNSMAYDVLATIAVLLFPRLFSVLDHYRYFSQLLIAFRLMAADLAAVFVLILISCSGFFVAFTMSFSDDEVDGAAVAYGLFQMLMGFTPAAWTAWDTYNVLGKAILTLFLFICHFLIVTILITVLTNSFMAIVSNANEEHQFVFAVNTISMVKNDALFSYVAPTNLLAWILTPLRYAMPFRQFVKLNRYVIKITHFPLLFSIYGYEKLFLALSVYEPTDLIENRGGDRIRLASYVDPTITKGLFSPSVRIRQEPVAGIQKDRALDEVFRLTPGDSARSTTKDQEQRQKTSVVNKWIDQHEGIASPPSEQDRSVVDRLERSRKASRREIARRVQLNREISGTRSVASDPADLMSVGLGAYQDFPFRQSDVILPPVTMAGEDGDDEMITNDDDENGTLERSNIYPKVEEKEDYFQTPTAPTKTPLLSTSAASSHRRISPRNSPAVNVKRSRQAHTRNLSTNTILYNPVIAEALHSKQSSSSASPPKSRPVISRSATTTNTPIRRGIHNNPKPRPMPPNRSKSNYASIPTLQQVRRRRSTFEMDSNFGLDANNVIGAVPSSFATQMALATGMGLKRAEGDDGGERMMARLMLARMKALEEGFADVVREFRGSRDGSAANTVASGEERKRDRKGKGVARSRPGTSDETGMKDSPEGRIIGDFINKGSSL
ncbi:MAG: hypothetical protein M1818_001157 [Claussenomyces sp. TS43310]|nr:MAG: hypothetical protein M1818_001157 [Claussenomyces sp. TS43310]